MQLEGKRTRVPSAALIVDMTDMNDAEVDCTKFGGVKGSASAR
jgi:hypothetical protein